MENALLYTLSTIAQTLGGAIALLSAFVLYKFNLLDAQMADAAKDLVEHARIRNLASLGDCRDAAVLRSYDRLLALLVAEDGVDKSQLSSGIGQKRRITEAFRRAVVLTGIALAVSIGALALNALLSGRVRVVVIALGVAFFGGCISAYWAVISAVLEIGPSRVARAIKRGASSAFTSCRSAAAAKARLKK